MTSEFSTKKNAALIFWIYTNNYFTVLLYYLPKFGFGTYMGFGNMIHETVSGSIVQAIEKLIVHKLMVKYS